MCAILASPQVLATRKVPESDGRSQQCAPTPLESSCRLVSVRTGEVLLLLRTEDPERRRKRPRCSECQRSALPAEHQRLLGAPMSCDWVSSFRRCLSDGESSVTPLSFRPTLFETNFAPYCCNSVAPYVAASEHSVSPRSKATTKEGIHIDNLMLPEVA